VVKEALITLTNQEKKNWVADWHCKCLVGYADSLPMGTDHHAVNDRCRRRVNGYSARPDRYDGVASGFYPILRFDGLIR
jgi:hypothetical protein